MTGISNVLKGLFACEASWFHLCVVYALIPRFLLLYHLTRFRVQIVRFGTWWLHLLNYRRRFLHFLLSIFQRDVILLKLQIFAFHYIMELFCLHRLRIICISVAIIYCLLPVLIIIKTVIFWLVEILISIERMQKYLFFDWRQLLICVGIWLKVLYNIQRCSISISIHDIWLLFF